MIGSSNSWFQQILFGKGKNEICTHLTMHLLEESFFSIEPLPHLYRKLSKLLTVIRTANKGKKKKQCEHALQWLDDWAGVARRGVNDLSSGAVPTLGWKVRGRSRTPYRVSISMMALSASAACLTIEKEVSWGVVLRRGRLQCNGRRCSSDHMHACPSQRGGPPDVGLISSASMYAVDDTLQIV